MATQTVNCSFCNAPQQRQAPVRDPDVVLCRKCRGRAAKMAADCDAFVRKHGVDAARALVAAIDEVEP